MTDIEKEVSEALASTPNYPLGEVDAMKWAVAWRLVRDRNGIDANASQASGDIDGWMVGWFANAMASAHPKMLIARDVEPSTREQAEEAIYAYAASLVRSAVDHAFTNSVQLGPLREHVIAAFDEAAAERV